MDKRRWYTTIFKIPW